MLLVASVFFLLGNIKRSAVETSRNVSCVDHRRGAGCDMKAVRTEGYDVMLFLDMTTNICVYRVSEEFPPRASPTYFERKRKNGWKWLSCSLGFKKNKKKHQKHPSDFKTQFPPWMKWCPPNCQVQTSNRPLCCPPPTTPCGSVPPPREAGWFSQNLSSTPWPGPCCRGRITGSCQSPARDKDRKGWLKAACFSLFVQHDVLAFVDRFLFFRSLTVKCVYVCIYRSCCLIFAARRPVRPSTSRKYEHKYTTY